MQKTFFLLTLLLSSVASVGAKPNILFCMADDWGWPHAGAYGDKVVSTPTFDRIAKEGVLFEHAFVSSPSCTPSRNATLTGQQFYRLEEGGNLWSTLDVKFPNFMMLLQNAGYQIGHERKAWGPGNYKKGGYKKTPCGPRTTLEKFLENRKQGQPFCFWLGTSDPHRAYKKGSGRLKGIKVDEIYVPEFYPKHDNIKSDIADYYFEVERWDSRVGEALKLLKEKGELENTIVIMTGDHGMPFPRCKGNLYDWGVRIPFAMRWGNKIGAERKVTDFISLTDIAPTLLKAAGVNIPKQMTGSSLLSLLESKKSARVEERRDHVIIGRERHVPSQKDPSLDGYPSRAIRTDEWLLILNLKPERWPAGAPDGANAHIKHFADCDNGPTKTHIMGLKDDPEQKKFYQLNFGKRPAMELYDCRADPDHAQNLASDPKHADTIKMLKSKLLDYLKETKDPRFTSENPEFDRYPYK
ncbi:MAG: sulfatase [Akkermansiaceae bacterium]